MTNDAAESIANALRDVAQAIREHSETTNACSHRLMGFFGYEGCHPEGTLDKYVNVICEALDRQSCYQPEVKEGLLAIADAIQNSR